MEHETRADDSVGHITITVDALRALTKDAAREGAKQAIRELGLEDLTRADFRDVRDLLSGWRVTKNAVWTTLVRMVTATLLTAMIAGIGLQFYRGG
ncbi:MAG: hypothetical protein Q7V31_12030 [Parvibaculum sp.]|uniref:DUF6127 family protein n=1 Tax=Parvibaculum sp. TaxID=2024848 RepID=UPI0027289995|nr:DUF6127 family protein [Parvibaculum sp.]MDO8839645.1 hypothetical protein [Parvibaculum sp.]